MSRRHPTPPRRHRQSSDPIRQQAVGCRRRCLLRQRIPKVRATDIHLAGIFLLLRQKARLISSLHPAGVWPRGPSSNLRLWRRNYSLAHRRWWWQTPRNPWSPGCSYRHPSPKNPTSSTNPLECAIVDPYKVSSLSSLILSLLQRQRVGDALQKRADDSVA